MTPRVTSNIRWLSGEDDEGLPPTLADLPPRPPPTLVDMMRGWTPQAPVNLDVLGPEPTTMETVGALAPLAGAALFAPSLPLALATIPAYHYLTSGKVQELPSIPSMPGEPWATALDIATGFGGGKPGQAGAPLSPGAIARLRARVQSRGIKPINLQDPWAPPEPRQLRPNRLDMPPRMPAEEPPAWLDEPTPVAEAREQFREAKEAARKPIYDRLQQAGDEARERLRSGFQGDELLSLFPGEKALDLATLTAASVSKGVKSLANRATRDMGEWGAARMAGGYVKFPEWSQQMLADAAEIHPQAVEFLQKNLRPIYKASQQTFKERAAETTAGRITDIQKILEYAEQGKEGTFWYKHVRPQLEPIFGADTDLFMNFLAATSPQTPVARNVELALKAYGEYKTGKPFSTEFEAHLQNLQRSVTGEPLSGLKVGSFVRNLMGDFIRVTVDTWMAQAYGFKGKVTDPQYRFMDYAISQAAKKKGLQPAEMQAAIWTGIKNMLGDPRLTGEPFEVVLKRYLKENPEIDRAIRQGLADRGPA